MDYREKIKEYRARIKNEDILKFVNFLASLLDWIDQLIENKSLPPEQKKEVMALMPEELFEEIDKISSAELSKEDYDRLKEILDEKVPHLVNHLIDNGNIKMTDFDLFQFNLYQIFGKEELASVVETARLHLEDVILKKRADELDESEKREKEGKEWLKKVNSLSQKAMNKLIIDSMFNFAPSARTHEERLKAIGSNRKKVLAQKNRFRKFEARLMEATDYARRSSQSNVYRQIGNVKRHMDKVTDEFREKAKEFVSDEGPKRMILGARRRIIEGRARVKKGEENLKHDLKGKGKEWKERFRDETENAQDKIIERQRELDMEIAVKGKRWKKAQEEILKNKSKLSIEEKQIKAHISERGEAEIDGARERMLEGKSDFEADIESAKRMFAGKGKEIGKARADFIYKREIAQGSFTRRGAEVEEEIYGTLVHERKRFEKERDKARDMFQRKAAEISGHALTHISEKRDKFDFDKKEAQERFLTRAGEVTAKPSGQKTESHGEKLAVKAGEAKDRIEKKNLVMIETARSNREKMADELKHRRDLFLYDTRFARHRIRENAKAFAEKAAAKREEFGARGEQLVARHKAHQKAHLIRNLLRTIRSMQ